MILKFAELNPHKACGEDIIPNALLKKYPRQFADMFLESFVCCLECHIEPIVWAGGNLHDMPKKVVSSCVSKRRGVLLEDVIGKVLHSFVRSEFVPHLNSYLLDSMYGGFLKRGTDFGTLHLRIVSNTAKHCKMSFGCIFADVSAAFESVARGLNFGAKPSDEEIGHLFRS